MANLHLVTGYGGSDHVTAADDGSLNAAIFGGGQYVLERGNNLSASALSSNLIRVLDGDILMQGRHIRVNEGTYVDLNIENGKQGMKRNDLIVCRYTKNASSGVEECNLVVIKGNATSNNPVDPSYTYGDILNNYVVSADFPLYRVKIDGISVSLERLFEIITVVKVGSSGKIDDKYLPSMDFIPTNQKGAAYGVPNLDSSGKIPSSQIPALEYVPVSQKGKSNGVATLDSSGAIPYEQIGFTSGTVNVNISSSGALIKNNSKWYKYGKLVFVVLNFEFTCSSVYGFSFFSISGYPNQNYSDKMAAGSVAYLFYDAATWSAFVRALEFINDETYIHVEQLDKTIPVNSNVTFKTTFIYLV